MCRFENARISKGRRVEGMRRLIAAMALGGVAATVAMAQPTFSINFQGPPKGAAPGCPPAFNLIQEGDILRPVFFVPAFGPTPPPCIFIDAGFGPPAPGLGLPMAPGPVAPAGVPDFVEVDALSYGMEPALDRSNPTPVIWYFSVDEWAVGIAGSPLPPAVWTEGAAGAGEAAADVFMNFFPIGTDLICSPALIGGNTAVIDGNGLAPWGGPGLGLAEPNFPGPGVPDMGANLDGLDMDTVPLVVPYTGAVYYSLDAGAAVFDFFEGFGGTGSAAANGGFVGGDVLMTLAPGGGPVLYAPAFLLGLDMFGPGTDDLDALILRENGAPGYQPPLGPYSWLFAGGSDMLLFSVRRGSAVIGMPDFFCGIPIEEGDILLPPPAPGMFPGIWIPAEAIGLATARSGFAFVGDDLDALDVVLDCNGNRQSDILDIATGISADLNGNGVPDECETAPCEPCDTNCDGTVNPFDIQPFLDILNGLIPPCSPCAGDANGNGTVNPFDITDFLACLGF